MFIAFELKTVVLSHSAEMLGGSYLGESHFKFLVGNCTTHSTSNK
jgi:hypothetical protein